MLRVSVLFAVPVLSLSPLLSAADLYKCVQGGRTVYQASPCAPGTGAVVELAPINSLGAPPSATPRTESLPGGGRQVVPLPVGPGWHAGADGYAAARDESMRSGRPLLVYFYTDWCPHCRHFDARVLTDAAVREKLDGYVKVRVNPEYGKREDGLHKLLGGRGIPHVVVQYPADGSAVRVGGTAEAPQFARALGQAAAKTGTAGSARRP